MVYTGNGFPYRGAVPRSQQQQSAIFHRCHRAVERCKSGNKCRVRLLRLVDMADFDGAQTGGQRSFSLLRAATFCTMSASVVSW